MELTSSGSVSPCFADVSHRESDERVDHNTTTTTWVPSPNSCKHRRSHRWQTNFYSMDDNWCILYMWPAPHVICDIVMCMYVCVWYWFYNVQFYFYTYHLIIYWCYDVHVFLIWLFVCCKYICYVHTRLGTSLTKQGAVTWTLICLECICILVSRESELG